MKVENSRKSARIPLKGSQSFPSLSSRYDRDSGCAHTLKQNAQPYYRFLFSCRLFRIKDYFNAPPTTSEILLTLHKQAWKIDFKFQKQFKQFRAFIFLSEAFNTFSVYGAQQQSIMYGPRSDNKSCDPADRAVSLFNS